MNKRWMEIEPLYCEKCGIELVDEFFFHKYDLENGDELYLCVSSCPKKKWYNFHTSLDRCIFSNNRKIFRKKKEN